MVSYVVFVAFSLEALSFFLFLKKYFIYLFIRDTEREAETQAEEEAGSLLEA